MRQTRTQRAAQGSLTGVAPAGLRAPWQFWLPGVGDMFRVRRPGVPCPGNSSIFGDGRCALAMLG